MPQEALQIWLVRTKAREILGPFSQAELFEQLRRHVFSFDDEIALSEGQWISAQTLAGWDTEEVTHTSTRNQTLTRSFSSPGNTPTRRDSFTEELTPTPEDVKALTVVSPSKPSDLAPTTPPSEQTVQPPRPLRASPVKIQKGAGRVLSAIIVAFIIGLFVVKMGKPVRDAPNVPSYQSMGSGLPIVKETYTLIQSGENREALRKLTQYHEKRPKDDLEYMVPYAALLILEKESVGRARKLLDQVLGTSTVPAVKAKAYLWLGYLLLSQEEGDMGENAFLESLQLNPRDAAARFNLGRTYLKQEKYAQALD
ncbi:MAG: tetratricopeptide repeat protein, partial [Deltaproteobacteria bacterium]|nr:tetratricopeptide repeat protein [Deltaproteobacteria bacterium]